MAYGARSPIAAVRVIGGATASCTTEPPVLHHPASRSPATSADIEIETYVLRCEHELLIYIDTANAIY